MNPAPSLSRVSGILITLAAAIIILAGIQAASSILGPFILSVYLTLILGTLLHWFERKGLSTRSALILTLIIFFAIIAVFIGMIAGSFIQAMSDLPVYLEKLESSIELASPFLISIGVDPATLTLQNLIQSFSAEIRGLISNLWDITTPLILIFLTTLFLLFEAKGFSQKLQDIIREHHPGDLDRFIDLAQKNVDYLVIRTAGEPCHGYRDNNHSGTSRGEICHILGFFSLPARFHTEHRVLDCHCSANAPRLVRPRAFPGPPGTCRVRADGHPFRIHFVPPLHSPGTGTLYCCCVHLSFFLGMDSWRNRCSSCSSLNSPCSDGL